MMPPSPVTREQLQKRIDSLQQHNRVLKVELETYKIRVKALQEETRSLRQASVIIVSSLSRELPRNKFPRGFSAESKKEPPISSLRSRNC